MSNARVTALTYLTGLSDKAFVEFFYEAVRDRVTSDIKEGHGHLILADAEKAPDGERWDIEFLALHDRQNYSAEWGDDSPICQSGTCHGCGQIVRSWAKKAICPVCGAQASCT